jgi:hypothetical protein
MILERVVLNLIPAAITSNGLCMASECRHWLGGPEVTPSSMVPRFIQPVFTYFRRTAYFFWQGSPIQFKACAVFQLSIDFGAYITILDDTKY